MTRAQEKEKEIRAILFDLDSQMNQLEGLIESMIRSHRMIPFDFFRKKIPFNQMMNFAGVWCKKTIDSDKKIEMLAYYPPGLTLDKHYHDCKEEIQVLTGKFQDLINRTILTQDQGLICKPFQAHKIQNISDTVGILRVTLFN